MVQSSNVLQAPESNPMASVLNRSRGLGWKRLLPGRGAAYLAAALCLGAIAAIWVFTARRVPNLSITPDRVVLALALAVALSYVLAWTVYLVLSREQPASKIGNAVLATMSLLFVIALIELPAWLRLIDYRLIIAPPESTLFTQLKPWENPRNQLDPELLHIHRPGQQFVGTTPGDLVNWLGIATDRRYAVNVQYDSHGFRNDHPITQAPVVAIGDSFLEAGLVGGAEVFTTRLARQLGVEVANLGQGGYGPQQELIVLKRYGMPLKPKIVLWFFFEGNDLLDAQRYQDSIRNWDATVNQMRGFPEDSFTRSALLALSGLLTPAPKQDSPEAQKRICWVKNGTDDSLEKMYLDYDGAPLSASDLTSLDTTESQVLQAQKLVSGSSAKFLLVYIPIKFRVYHDFCQFPNDGYGKTWQLNDLPSRMQAWSQAHGIDFLDLTPPLKDAAAAGQLVYFADDGHWNAGAHAIVSSTLAGFIKAHNWEGTGQ